jgi:sirohydrochlorin cobaltochelatase
MPNWTDASLLIVAHGSTQFPGAALDLRRIAGKIAERALFADIKIAFWRQEPFVSPELLHGSRIYVLPYFAGLGKHTEQFIPEKLALTGRVTEQPGKLIFYCDPVGCHAGMPSLIFSRAMARCAEIGWDVQETALLLIAHGSKQGSGANRTPEVIAASLALQGGFAEITTLYLEQQPFAASWQDHVSARRVIAQPLLLSAGMHASSDVPPLFGLETAENGLGKIAGRSVWLQKGVGSDEEIITMMLDQVADAEKEAIS